MTKFLACAFAVIFLLTCIAKVSAIEEGIPCDLSNPQCDNVNQRGETLFCKPLVFDHSKATCEVFPIPEGEPCIPNSTPNCAKPLFCVPLANDRANGTCEVSNKPRGIQDIFGKIKPPPPLKGLLEQDPTGAGGISKFLSNLIALFFTLAMIVLVLMIIWGAFDWLISEGEKEKIAGAQKKIINAIIGIILFAIAFAIIRVLGQFTGFAFFKGQNYTVITRDSQGKPTTIRCFSDGQDWSVVYRDPDTVCPP